MQAKPQEVKVVSGAISFKATIKPLCKGIVRLVGPDNFTFTTAPFRVVMACVRQNKPYYYHPQD